MIELESASTIHSAEREIPPKSSSEFFYSEPLGKFISYEPLKVSDRVLKAAQHADIQLDWDDEGRVSNISFFDTKKLLAALGSSLLSPSEYWTVHQQAIEQQDTKAIASLESDTATEWLDVVFLREKDGAVTMIEHPILCEQDGITSFEGQRTQIDQPYGRPGWFNPKENIDPRTGMPRAVDSTREKGTKSWSDATWKYWSSFQTETPVVGIRGYVTSSGTPSLDLDIPPEAKQTVLTIRECRTSLLEPNLRPALLEAAEMLSAKYKTTTVDTPGTQNSQAHEYFYQQKEAVFQFLTQFGTELRATRNSDARKIEEKLIDMLGILRLEAERRGDHETLTKIQNETNRLFPLDDDAGSYEALEQFLMNSQPSLREALETKRSIVFVMGHKNPDTDTVISSLFEAYRNALIDQDALYIPVVQASRMPDEISALLGASLDASYIMSSNELYERAKQSGLARWILVDHNTSEQQKFALNIIDHHILSETAEKQDIGKTWEMVGSCSAQITQKLYGIGITPDQKMAEILHGATLMDTENRGEKKMTYRDVLIMDRLQELSAVSDEHSFYQELMSHLLNTDDAEHLFIRDYKQDWGIWGFAVAKVKDVFDSDGNVRKPALLKHLREQAAKNNEEKNFAMTLVKVVDYLEDNETVNREKLLMVFNSTALPEFKAGLFHALERIIAHEYAGQAQMAITDDAIEFWGVGDQLSRKVTAPKIEPLIKAFNEYYYSQEVGKYVSREFLTATPEVMEVAERLGIHFSSDKEGRVTNITFLEAKRLLSALGMSMLSLPEYWRVRSEVIEMHDEQMQSHVHAKGFVEFLDTVILDHQRVIHHPEVIDGQYQGEEESVMIKEALPALIYPEDIDDHSGFPTIVYTAEDKYADPRTWRYWSPDASIAIPTRGHIFLLDKPALDTKIHPDDALPNLGIRTCVDHVTVPSLIITEENDEVIIQVTSPN